MSEPASAAVPSQWPDQLAAQGWCFLPEVLPAELARWAGEACGAALDAAAASGSVLASGRGSTYGARNLLEVWPQVRALLAWPPLALALRQTLGAQAGLVRGLYFDKPPGSSWSLPWHRDQTIAVRRHVPSERFLKPTIKAGVPHVQAPVELLSQMLTARIHLDPMTSANGPVRVISGSHLGTEAADEAGEQRELHCTAGAVLLMRPLLLHASGHSAEGAGHRRILHLELAAAQALDDGLEWHDFVRL